MNKQTEMSLSKKLVTFFVALVALLMLIMSISNYMVSLKQQQTEYMKSNSNILKLSSINISSQIRQILDLTLSPYKDETLFLILSGKGYENESQNIKNSLLSIFNSNGHILQVNLYSFDNGTYYSVSNKWISQHPASPDPSWEENPDIVLSTQSSSENTLQITRKLYNLPGNNLIGIISIDVGMDYFINSNGAIMTNENETIAVVSESGEILYCNSGKNKLEKILTLHSLQNGYGNATVRDGSNYLLLYNEIEPGSGVSSLYIVKMIKESIVTRNAAVLAASSLLIGCIMALLSSVLIIILASKNFTKPFGYIEKQLEKIAKGNLDVHLDLHSSEEFSRFASQFNTMISNINNFIIMNYRLEIENKNNQLKALQAQLDPHFINNTLQTIGNDALKQGNLELYTAIVQFGGMMRYTMNFRDMNVPFKDELEYTENYLKFQQKRFPGRFTYNLNISKTSLSVIIPKLVLQPLVENSIKHGLGEKTSVMEINIITRTDGDYFHMECRNSGNGLDENSLEQLKKSIETARINGEESANVGLRNLARRLFLLYGEKAVMDIGSKNNSGFTVTLTIPIGRTNEQRIDCR